jgi:hypothetical protein
LASPKLKPKGTLGSETSTIAAFRHRRAEQLAKVAFGSITTETRCPRYVRLSLNLRHYLAAKRTLKRARKRHSGADPVHPAGAMTSATGSRPNRWPPTYVQALLALSPWHHDRWLFPATASFPDSSPTAASPQEHHRWGWCRRCRSAVYRSPRDFRSASGCHRCSPDAGSGDVSPNLPTRGSRECRTRSEARR